MSFVHFCGFFEKKKRFDIAFGDFKVIWYTHILNGLDRG